VDYSWRSDALIFWHADEHLDRHARFSVEPMIGRVIAGRDRNKQTVLTKNKEREESRSLKAIRPKRLWKFQEHRPGEKDPPCR